MNDDDKAPEPSGPSFPYGGVLIIFAVLVAIAYQGRESWWGIVPHLLALGFLGWAGFETSSRKAFEHIQKQYPGETRDHWVLNSLLCYLVFPGLLWLVLGAPLLVLWSRR